MQPIDLLAHGTKVNSAHSRSILGVALNGENQGSCRSERSVTTCLRPAQMLAPLARPGERGRGASARQFARLNFGVVFIGWQGKKESVQADLAERAGVSFSFISRFENGHALPSIETLEQLALALDTPIYRFFCDDEVPLSSLLRKENPSWQPELNRTGKWEYLVEQFRNLLGGLLDEDRKLLLHVAARAARKRKT